MRVWVSVWFCALIGALVLASPATAAGLSLVLTVEQQALLGCGEFYGTDCAVEGIDLLNTEAATLLQSFPQAVPQPGTGWPPPGPVGTIFLPGARGPSGLPGEVLGVPGSDLRYTPVIDGHPFAGQDFQSELSALSWNYLMLLTAGSRPAMPGTVGLDEFSSELPFRPDGCSFANPSGCSAVQNVVGSGPAVPEPGAALLFAGGLAMVAVRLRTQRRSRA